jgi:hypothetical protein
VWIRRVTSFQPPTHFPYVWCHEAQLWTVFNARNTSRSNLSQSPQQIRPRIFSNLPSDLCAQKLWKPITFAMECKFTVAVNISQKKFTKNVNFRRCVDKWFRSAFGAAVECKIVRNWNYIWVTEKWNVNMVSSTSKIILVVFLYLSYIIHAPTSQNSPSLAPLHKSGRIPYYQCFWKYIKTEVFKSWSPGRRGDYISYDRRLIFAAYTFQYKNRYQFKRTEHKSPLQTEVKTLLQNCGFSVWELHHGTILTPKLWRAVLGFWKFCVFLFRGLPIRH